MKKITIALLGAGQRVRDCYEPYALKYPYEVQFVAIAEPVETRRARFQQLHGISAHHSFSDWRSLLDRPRLADALLICTPDRLHFEPVMAAMQKGYHILLEKPISPDPVECLQIGEAAGRYPQVLLVGHVLRYMNLFATLKECLDAGAIGQLLTIEHSENVAYWHHAHSFVRGNWRKAAESAPMILTKSCHDMDLLHWLASAECTRLSSFGFLSHFTPEHAPAGAPMHCLDGCPAAHHCLYYAPAFYLTGETGWPASVISEDTSQESLRQALRTGPYGRCVYHCDNDVVDHQVVSMEFANHVTAVFTMCAFTNQIHRTIRLLGTQGELEGVVSHQQCQIEQHEFARGTRTVISLPNEGGPQGHAGGDFGLMRHFVSLIAGQSRQKGISSAASSVHGHLMAFAAEQSRCEGRLMNMQEFVGALT